jgi:hypothetical protein
MSFVQSGAVRDYIFPVALCRRSGDGEFAVDQVIGTAFFIGNRGFALTAGHVVPDKSALLVGMFVLGGSWHGFTIPEWELHPKEDVAILKVSEGPWKSFFRLSNTDEHASCKYRLFGYPEDTTHEMVEGGRTLIRPDMIYNEGYIRRRFSSTLPAMTGQSFFELSEVAGRGCSGSPVCKLTAPIWEVIGIYIGEKINDRATSVSYAVREDSFRDWKPEMLGCSILDESKNVSI